MAEEEMIFDPSMKKKKKKKKAFDLDAALAEEEGGSAAGAAVGGEEEAGGGESAAGAQQESTATGAATAPVPATEDKELPPDVSLDLDDFSSMKKKKKKKKKIFDPEAADDADKDKDGDDESRPESAADTPTKDDLDFDLDLPMKKKKKKKAMVLDDLDNDKENDMLGDGEVGGGQHTWSGSDRDYTYDELLTRVFQIMRDKNPEIGEKKRFVMRPPQVVRVGAKKSSFVNFTDICKMLHRQPKHLLAFLLAELGTSGSIDGTNQLIIKGKFQQKQIENVLRRYIKEYVTCHTCRSPDTILQKDTRLYFLQCESCGSRCSVTSIKSGFQALTGKRAAIRAKTT